MGVVEFESKKESVLRGSSSGVIGTSYSYRRVTTLGARETAAEGLMLLLLMLLLLLLRCSQTFSCWSRWERGSSSAPRQLGRVPWYFHITNKHCIL